MLELNLFCKDIENRSQQRNLADFAAISRAYLSVYAQVIHSVNKRKIVLTNMISFVSFANRNIIFCLYDFSL